ncbi:D-aspartate oxidase [Bombus pyrosoma]|uniref:D-aspartate oxidase n=1 Tax=Bombus pyrosoma TaxID=396416 RepID=UPI001CB9A843|nr:D-aspartate oxidase [Bombus pyrosoma]
MRVAVVGAGVIGMTSAFAVKSSFPQFEVQIFSDKFSPATTGDGSAGMWSPYLLGSTPCDKISQWGEITHRWLENFWKAGLASEIGLSLIPVYRVTSNPDGFFDLAWTKVVYGAYELNPSELEKLNVEWNANYKHGWMFLTYTCEPVRLLPWLMKRFLHIGGKIRNRKIHTFNELIDDGYDLIINCSGLGAHELVGDNAVRSIRGQVARVTASWVMHGLLVDDDDGNYIIPNIDSVVLGGTHQENDFDCTPREEDSEFIYNGCVRILPALKGAEIAKEWVGLRPGRYQVRIEAEVCRSSKGRQVTVIHNYGHGGSGVTLCWGCALNVVNIVENMTSLKSNL